MVAIPAQHSVDLNLSTPRQAIDGVKAHASTPAPTRATHCLGCWPVLSRQCASVATHAHSHSCVTTSQYFACYCHAYALVRLPGLQVFDQATQLGFHMRILDIGGGFAGGCFDAQGQVQLGQVPLAVNSALATYFSDPTVKVS